MPFKDKEKQKVAAREAMRRMRAKRKVIPDVIPLGETVIPKTEGLTNDNTEGLTPIPVIPLESVIPVIPPDIGILPEGVLDMLKRDTEWRISIGAEPKGSPNVQARLQAMRRAMRPSI